MSGKACAKHEVATAQSAARYRLEHPGGGVKVVVRGKGGSVLVMLVPVVVVMVRMA